MEALELELSPDPRAVTEARGAVTRRFGHLPEPALDDLRLLITELVTNAVVHGEPGDDVIRVSVTRDGDRVHAEVVDSSSAEEIRPKPLDPASPGGFGLHLVQELSDRWGVRHGTRTCVWFELTPRSPGGDLRPSGAEESLGGRYPRLNGTQPTVDRSSSRLA
jgi:anti-sigma regulatory factor (Ser/Thr protein kinase)